MQLAYTDAYAEKFSACMLPVLAEMFAFETMQMQCALLFLVTAGNVKRQILRSRLVLLCCLQRHCCKLRQVNDTHLSFCTESHVVCPSLSAANCSC